MGHSRLALLRRCVAVRTDYPDQSADSDRAGIRSRPQHRGATADSKPGSAGRGRFASVEAMIQSVIPTEAEGSHPVIGVRETVLAPPRIAGDASTVFCA